MKTINYLEAFNGDEKLKERYEAVKDAAKMLALDVYSGPFYIGTEEDDGEELTFKDETIRVVSWDDANKGTLFGSDFAKKITKEVEDIVSELPCYYLPDCENWSDKRPEPEVDEEYGALEEEPYSEISEGDWYSFFFSPATYRDIMGL